MALRAVADAGARLLPMKRILFVEDDAALRAQLRATPTLERARWQLVFARSGEAARSELAGADFDAIVCDLDLASVDGPALLETVQQSHPNTVRLCLAGSAEGEAFLRAVPVTHQFLSKPCHPDTLCEVLERTCALREILGRPQIRALVAKLRQLPATPQTFTALAEAMARPNAHVDTITGIVSRDTSLSLKTLQIVNSAFFRRSATINSIGAAVAYVGLEMIKSLALSACMFNALDASPQASGLLQDLQARSLRRAQFARMLLEGSRHADEGFTAALLLDVGQVVLALGSPQQFERMCTAARERGAPWHAVEPEFFGAAHPEVGAYLLALWGLPLELIEAVAYHHAPSRVEHGQTEVLLAAHVADAVIAATGDCPARLLDRLDPAFVARPEIARRLKDWMLDPDGAVPAAQQLQG